MYFHHSFREASFFPFVIVVWYIESFSVTLEIKTQVPEIEFQDLSWICSLDHTYLMT